VDDASVPDSVELEDSAELEDSTESEEELWESEEEDELEDQDDVTEEEEELEEEQDEPSRSTMMQKLKEFSETFKLPNFNFQEAVGWKWMEETNGGNLSVECQSDYVNVDNDDLFGNVDPSILLFEVEEDQGDYKNSPIPNYNKVKPAYLCVS